MTFSQKVLRLAAHYADNNLSIQIEQRTDYYKLFLDRSSYGLVRRHPLAFGLSVMVLTVLLIALVKMKMDERRELEQQFIKTDL